MMDVVPKKHRGFWNSLEGVTAFTWTGSAALGGWLISTRDYRFTFLVTGALYIAGTSVLFLTIPLTWGEVVEAGPLPASKGKAARSGGSGDAAQGVAAVVDVAPVTAADGAVSGVASQQGPGSVLHGSSAADAAAPAGSAAQASTAGSIQ